MIATTFATLYQPGDVCEVRAILRDKHGLSPHWAGWSSGIVYGYFDNGADLASAVQPLDDAGLCSGIYVTLNPVMPDLLARSMNRLSGAKKGTPTATDTDIVCRRWILVDVDPVRPTGVSATKDELRIAVEVAKQVKEYNRAAGMPDPTMALSGNGIHLLYPVDLPNDDKSRDDIRALLLRLSGLFSTSKANVDPVMFNAARITKLYGTVARKGDNHPVRMWRRSELIMGE